MSASQKAFLAPFDENTQSFLSQVDKLCIMIQGHFQEASLAAELKGEGFEPSPDDMILQTLMRGFGILYNRTLEAGWAERGIVLNGISNRTDSRAETEEVSEGTSSIIMP